MGYEVLDTTGEVGPLSRAGAGASLDDVLDLESLPPPPDDGPPLGGRWRWPSGRRGGLLVGVLALGMAGLGVTWGEHHSASHRAAGGPIKVLAVAQRPDMAQFGAFSAASVRVTLMNLGDRPVEIVTSWPGVRPTAGTTLVGLAAGSARVMPGTSQPVVVVVGISCHDRTPVAPQVEVRDETGETHPVQVRDDELKEYLVRPGLVCGLPDGMPLAASVGGSLRSPVLLLHNGTAHDLKVDVDPDSAVRFRPPMTGQVPRSVRAGSIGPALTVSTSPQLPVVVPAGGTSSLSVGVQVRGCSVLPSLRRTAYLSLLGQRLPVEHSPPEDVTAGVDLSALVGAQLADICS